MATTNYTFTLGGPGNTRAYTDNPGTTTQFQKIAGSFNLDSSWFKPDGSINATATSSAIMTAQGNDNFVFGGGDSSHGFYTKNEPSADASSVITGASLSQSNGEYVLDFTAGTGEEIHLAFQGKPTGTNAGIVLDDANSYEVNGGTTYKFDSSDRIVCFAKGTLISTAKGLVAVEKLKAGDQVLTIDGEHAPIVWLGHRRVNCLKHSQPELANPVRVSKDAFGPGMPSADVFLSPAHAVYAYGHLVPVRHLINDVTITQESVDSITYYHVELPKHSVILAQGLPAETYLDSDNRAFFISADQPANVEPLQTVEFSENYGRDLYLANCYAPFVTEGPVLEAIQEKLLAMPAAQRLALAA